MPDELIIIMSLDGALSFIHDDALNGLLNEGTAVVSRASNVEPYVDPDANTGMFWQADMSPVADVKLPPTRLRSESLAMEREWLYRNYFCIGV